MTTPIIAIANQKGGVGKTTTSVNLSACLAERQKKTLLIDLDPQANATSGLGIEKKPGKSAYQALLGEGELLPLIQSTSLDRLDLIASEVDLAGAEVDVARAERYLHRFTEAVAPIKNSGDYDYILLDCPPSLGILTMNALTASNSILIPIQCEYFALEGLSVITRLVQQLRDGGANPTLDIEGILMTMFDARTNLSQQVVHEVKKHFGVKLYDTVIPRSVRLSEAPSFGKTIIQYDKHCLGAAAYRQLAREFLKRRKPAEKPAAAPAPVATVQPPVPTTVTPEAVSSPTPAIPHQPDEPAS